MPSDSQKAQVKVVAGWALDLACPACHAALEFEEARVVCSGCGRMYPIIDGLPVLIAERATEPASQKPGSSTDKDAQ